MSVVGLFAGIGGFELAFSQAGYHAEMLVELDPAAQTVLKTRFPDAEVRSDVTDVNALPDGVEIVTAGFPCQNLSMAGDKSGIAGPKSGAVGKMLRLVERSKVPVVVIENVYFMLQLDAGEGMRWLVQQFEALGYRWAYRVLDTMGFRLPHRRRRVYFVACRDLDPRTVLFADEGDTPPPAAVTLDAPVGFYWTEGRSGVGLTVDGIPPLKVGSAVGIASAPAVLFPDGEVLTPSLAACERLQGFPTGWTGLDGVRRGRSPGWRMVGNAVSVPVARWVAERIRQPGSAVEFECGPIVQGRRWPDAAWNIGAGRVGVVASDRPVAAERPSISAFRDATWSHLSARALDGFVRRAREGRLRMPDGFLDALIAAERRPA